MLNEVGQGYNTVAKIVGDTIEKTSVYSFEHSRAEQLAEDLDTYHESFAHEPVAVPDISNLDVFCVDSVAKLYKVKHSMEIIDGPMLTSIEGNELDVALTGLIEQIHGMDTLGNGEEIAVPIDANATNFCVADSKAVLIDLFPPLPRDPDGTLNLRNVQYNNAPIRRNVLPYLLGTKAGAIMNLIFTAKIGSPSLKQPLNLLKNVDWAYDILPSNIDPYTKEIIHKEARRHFAGHFAKVNAANVFGLSQKLLKRPPYSR